MAEEENCTIQNIDFKTRTCKESLQVPHDTGIPQILRSMAEYAAKNGVESVIITTMDGAGMHQNVHEIKNEAHKALLCLILEDIRAELKAQVFHEDDELDGAG